MLVQMVLAMALLQQSPPRGVVSGVVQDQTGAILPGAEVVLASADGPETGRSVITDERGTFRFERVAPGAYEIRTAFPGFTPNVTRVRVTGRAPSTSTVVLQIEGLTQEVSVSGGGGQASASAAANLNAITIDGDALDDLPVLDQDIVGAMSRFLDSSAIGTGGTTILVDGVEVNSLALTASAVQQIKINQDPYAAEFMRPGRGRIEIVSKPGGRVYSGTFNLRFRDSAFYARNAFSATKPPQQRRIFEGTFGGPVPGAAKTSFTASGSFDAEDSQANVYANLPSGIVQLNAPTPSRHLVFSGSWNHQHSEKTLQSIRYSHVGEKNANQGVGGVNLPEAGSNRTTREDELILSQQTIFSPHLLNDVKFLFGVEYEPRSAVTQAPRIVVLDAFTGGGAQSDTVRTEHHFTLVEAITWSPGRHVVKFGVNIPDWSWRGFDDRSNRLGTFYFSSNADYVGHRPYSFVHQAGDGQVEFLEKVLGAFVQDEIRLRPNLSLDVGLRYDWQNYFHDGNNFAPRLSFAWAPGESTKTIVRGGAGLFYDRTGAGPIQDLLRYDGEHLQRYVMTDPGYPNPLPPGESFDAQASSLVRLSPDVRIPATLQYSAGVERQLSARATVSVNFIGSRGIHMFRSRDVNAPPPPAYAARPDPEHAVVRQIESEGTQRTESVQVTLRGQVTKRLNGSVDYSFGRAMNDTNGIGWMPPNSYDLSLEYARAEFNQRHRVELFGTLNGGRNFTFGFSASASTGRPYSMTTGQDRFNTGTANARPDGVPRNSLDGPSFANLDLRWSREFTLPSAGGRKRSATIGVDAFNVLNTVNYSYYVGNLSSPFYGEAIASQPARRIQFSFRLRT